jgi:hypothetical protein
MAMVKCHECGNEISSEAEACPKCGAKPRPAVGVFGWLFVLAVAYGAWSFFSPSSAPPKAPPSPAEIAYQQPQEQLFQKTAIMAATIKRGLREPASVQWETIMANDDGSVMCFLYRARNGFGGMTRENVSFANGKASKDAAHWNKHCTNKSLNDLIHVRQALK